ncbi:MAG: serine hydrolase [Pseudomonadota bacterium]
MTDLLLSSLQRACDAFADQAGEISILVEGISHSAAASIAPRLLMPAASVIKLAIACAAFEDDSVDLDLGVELKDMDETFYCSILKAFSPSTALSLKELIGLMLIISDNPATTAVMDHIEPARVAHWMSANGMTQSRFSAGFTDQDLSGRNRANVTTAQDCLTLLKQVYDPSRPFAEIRTFLANNLRNDRIPKRLPDDVVIMHKTGTLSGLVHDIAIVESPHVSYYFTVLANALPDPHKFAFDLAIFSEQVYELMLASAPRQ